MAGFGWGDNQSPASGVGRNPTDRGKQGIKRSLLTDAAGLPVSLVIDGANRHDMKLARATLEAIVIPRLEPTPEQPQNLCLDNGYDDDEVRELAEAFGYTAHSRTRTEEARTIKREAGAKVRRWGVECTPRGMNRFRRILTRWEKRAESYLARLHLACGLITW